MEKSFKYLISIILMTLISLSTTTHFLKTLNKNMSDFELFLANQEGELFNLLPQQAKQSGKQIIITMPDCQSDTIVKITHPGIANMGKDTINQVITFTPTEKSQTVQIPQPFDTNDQNILVEIVQKTNAYINYHAFFKTHNIEELTPQQQLELIALSKLHDQEPQNVIQLNYATLSNDQTITLPYPATNKPTVNYLNDKIVANLNGAVFNALPDSIKKSGKQITLSIPNCGTNIRVTIRQTIKAAPDLGLVSQEATFTNDIHEITVYLPEIQENKSQEIMVQTAADKNVKQFNKNFKKYHNKMHTLTEKQRKTLFKPFPKSFSHYQYAKLKNGQTLKLTCPTKITF